MLSAHHLGSGSTSFWTMFNSNEDRTHSSTRDASINKSYGAPVPNMEHSFSTIQLREVNYLNFLMIVILKRHVIDEYDHC
jgi:hypothetical protein